MLAKPGYYRCTRCDAHRISRMEREMCEEGHPRVAMDLDVQLPETLYATRKGGRSRGVLHLFRDCSQIVNIPDEDVIDREWTLFDSEQDICGSCLGRQRRVMA